MIPVTINAPTGQVSLNVKPNSVLLLLFDGDGRPLPTRIDVPHFEAAKTAASQALKDIMAASVEAAKPKDTPPADE